MMSRIENWQIVPMFGYICLIGDIYNDPRAPDGTTFRTSKLKAINFDEMVAATQNTVYRLGSQAAGTRMLPKREVP